MYIIIRGVQGLMYVSLCPTRSSLLVMPKPLLSNNFFLCASKNHFVPVDYDNSALIGRWITGEWQSCTKPCGVGTSRRHAYCVEELQDGSFRNTYDNLCRAPRPTVERPCNQHACPKWYAGSWSPVSQSMGRINNLQK